MCTFTWDWWAIAASTESSTPPRDTFSVMAATSLVGPFTDCTVAVCCKTKRRCLRRSGCCSTKRSSFCVEGRVGLWRTNAGCQKHRYMESTCRGSKAVLKSDELPPDRAAHGGEWLRIKHDYFFGEGRIVKIPRPPIPGIANQSVNPFLSLAVAIACEVPVAHSRAFYKRRTERFSSAPSPSSMVQSRTLLAATESAEFLSD